MSDKYDFSNTDVRNEYVAEMGCSFGGCISMLRKSWKSYKAARREGYADRCLELEHRINSIRAALGIEDCSFGWAGVNSNCFNITREGIALTQIYF